MEAEKARPTDKVEYPALHIEERKEVELPVSIKSIEEEELQLSELYAIEKSQLHEVVTHLVQLLKSVDTPIHMDPSSFSDVVLMPDGKITLANSGNAIASFPIESLPGSAMISVLVQTVPEIKRILVEKKLATAERTSVLEKSAKEFRKVTAALPDKSKKEPNPA